VTAVASELDGHIPVSKIIASQGDAFAAIRNDGSVITWGCDGGSDSSAVAEQLKGVIPVVDIKGTANAFAALRADGSVVAWGAATVGGDMSAVGSALNGSIPVVSIFASSSAFAALRADGSVITWGALPETGFETIFELNP
jgi:alpha-tubulin suppressor-like RCC1 family protein